MSVRLVVSHLLRLSASKVAPHHGARAGAAVTWRGSGAYGRWMSTEGKDQAEEMLEAQLQQLKHIQQQTQELQHEDEAEMDRLTTSTEAFKVLSVSRKGLLKTSKKTVDETKKVPRTPLINEALLTIGVNGPLSVSDWMKMCLGHPQHGYYMKKDVFGQKGDFITSPEITPIFGELIAIWCVRTWQAMGSPKRFRLVECGPGRGTLMKDLLRISRRFPTFRAAIKAVHLVENSPVMRELQREALKVNVEEQDPTMGIDTNADMAGRSEYREVIRWHWQVQDIPEDLPLLLIANEFFDALPVHCFQHTERGWHEKMIHLDESDSHKRFEYVLSPSLATSHVIPTEVYPHPPAGHPNEKAIECSPVSGVVIQSIANKIKKNGGAALVIDYGQDSPLTESVQAVKDHKFVDVLSDPGENDITALVDFSALRAAVESIDARPDEKKIVVHPVVRQMILLRELGIQSRVESIIKDQTEEDQLVILEAAQRLVEDENKYSMGVLFKAFCISDEDVGVPTGFYKDE